MKRVLVIDDSTSICSWLAKFIERKGKAHVTEATNIDAANGALHVEEYDIIFCDISMPDQDGDDFLLAHQDLIGAAQIIMISANDDDRLIQAQTKLLDGGFKSVSYIQKPLNLSEVFEIVSNDPH